MKNLLQIVHMKYLIKNYCTKYIQQIDVEMNSDNQLIKKTAKRTDHVYLMLDVALINRFGVQSLMLPDAFKFELVIDSSNRKQIEYRLKFSLKENGYKDAGQLIIDLLNKISPIDQCLQLLFP